MSRKTEVSFPTIGQIRKGAAKRIIQKNGRDVETVGQDLGRQFRVVFSGGAEVFERAFLEATDVAGLPIYGSLQPDVIRATLTFRDVASCWSCFDEAYTSGRLVAQGKDGELLMFRDPLNGEYLVRGGALERGVEFLEDGQGRLIFERTGVRVLMVGCSLTAGGISYNPGASIVYERAGKRISLKLKTHGILKLWLPVFGRLVLMELRTTSFYDRLNIDANLGAIQAMADAFNQGNVAGIPLLIYRRLTNISRTTEDGGAARTDKWLVQIEADPEWVRTATQLLHRQAFGQLPAPAAPVASADLVAPAGSPDPDGEDDDEPVDGEVTDLGPDPQPDPEPVPDVPVVDHTPAPAAPAAPVASTARAVRNISLAEAVTLHADAYGFPGKLLGQLEANQVADILTTLEDRKRTGKTVNPVFHYAVGLVLDDLISRGVS